MGLAEFFPCSIWTCPWLAPCALVLDLLLGDPRLPWPHPVCFLGAALGRLEKPARASGIPLRLAGLCALLVLLLLAGAFSLGLLWLARISAIPLLFELAALYLAFSGLAFGCLMDAGREVLLRVEHYPLPEARNAVSTLVSRETRELDRQTLRKTLADTLSENFTDAFMAPYFWLVLGGPVALWLYKAASTADSLWGYKTERWHELGWAAARLDDLLAWLPARISALALWLTDYLRRKFFRAFAPPWPGYWPGFAVMAAQAKGMPSPNSGWSMAACAWLCGAGMAGPSVYFGEFTPKPWLGPGADSSKLWNEQRLLALLRLMRYAALCGGLGLWLVGLMLRLALD